MFGYVKTFTPELKVCEAEHYKAVYCGLCKVLGKKYGFFSRFTLNYDFTFLALVYKDITNEEESVKKCRCIAHPFKCKSCVYDSLALDFSAACAMIMLYYKVLDNIRDSGFFKKILYCILLPICKAYYKKATLAHPNLERVISDNMKRQEGIEKRDDVFLDMAADPSACVLRDVFSLMSSEEDKKSALGRFGYLLGRWVYLIDALDDLESDKKNGSFNVFLQSDNRVKNAIESLNSTAAELQNAYAQVGFQKFAPVISNVVFLGLKDTLNRVIKKGGYSYE